MAHGNKLTCTTPSLYQIHLISKHVRQQDVSGRLETSSQFILGIQHFFIIIDTWNEIEMNYPYKCSISWVDVFAHSVCYWFTFELVLFFFCSENCYVNDCEEERNLFSVTKWAKNEICKIWNVFPLVVVCDNNKLKRVIRNK